MQLGIISIWACIATAAFAAPQFTPRRSSAGASRFSANSAPAVAEATVTAAASSPPSPAATRSRGSTTFLQSIAKGRVDLKPGDLDAIVAARQSGVTRLNSPALNRGNDRVKTPVRPSSRRVVTSSVRNAANTAPSRITPERNPVAASAPSRTAPEQKPVTTNTATKRPGLSPPKRPMRIKKVFTRPQPVNEETVSEKEVVEVPKAVQKLATNEEMPAKESMPLIEEEPTKPVIKETPAPTTTTTTTTTTTEQPTTTVKSTPGRRGGFRAPRLPSRGAAAQRRGSATPAAAPVSTRRGSVAATPEQEPAVAPRRGTSLTRRRPVAPAADTTNEATNSRNRFSRRRG